MRKVRIAVSKKVQERENMFFAAVDALAGGAAESVVVPWAMADGVVNLAFSLSPLVDMGGVSMRTPTYGICGGRSASGTATIEKRTLSYAGINTMGSGALSFGLIKQPDGFYIGY